MMGVEREQHQKKMTDIHGEKKGYITKVCSVFQHGTATLYRKVYRKDYETLIRMLVDYFDHHSKPDPTNTM
jgi:hypothetical protein